MCDIGVHLKDYAGRDFGGEFELLQVSKEDELVSIVLQYSGRKASKKMTIASLQLPESVFEQILAAMAPKAVAA